METKRIKFIVQSFPANIRAKWPEDILDEGFTPFPKRFLRCADLILGKCEAIDDFRVLMALADYQRPATTPPARIQMLASIAGMESREFTKRLLDLQLRQIVDFERQGDFIDVVTMRGLARLVVSETPEGT